MKMNNINDWNWEAISTILAAIFIGLLIAYTLHTFKNINKTNKAIQEYCV